MSAARSSTDHGPFMCACSWVGGDPDQRRVRGRIKSTCPACWKIDRRRVEVQPMPPCYASMRCMCALHGRGAPAFVHCNADEAAWPCRFCWAYFPDGGFEVNAAGDCAACGGTGVHPDDDGDPSKDEDAEPVAKCPKCGGTEDLCVTETYTAYHPFNAVKQTATNALGKTCPSEHFDDGRSDYGMACLDCLHEGSLSEFGATLTDWD